MSIAVPFPSAWKSISKVTATGSSSVHSMYLRAKECNSISRIHSERTGCGLYLLWMQLQRRSWFMSETVLCLLEDSESAVDFLRPSCRPDLCCKEHDGDNRPQSCKATEVKDAVVQRSAAGSDLCAEQFARGVDCTDDDFAETYLPRNSQYQHEQRKQKCSCDMVDSAGHNCRQLTRW